MANEKKGKEEAKKVKRPTCQKREEQNVEKRLRNKAFRSRVRTALKGFLESVKQGNAQESTVRLSEVASLVDKGVNKGVFTRNKANRVKARLAAKLQVKQAA
jgi:small subunit ribosomal protein S20